MSGFESQLKTDCDLKNQIHWKIRQEELGFNENDTSEIIDQQKMGAGGCGSDLRPNLGIQRYLFCSGT